MSAADRIPLSFNQEHMCTFDEGDDKGPFGPRYNVVYGWRLRGPVDVEVLRAAFTDVVTRHEALRTLIVRDGEDRYQVVHPPSTPELAVHDLSGTAPEDRETRAEELLIEAESGEFDMRVPLIRAVLGRFGDDHAVLALIVHHTAVDGWSMQLIIKEVAECYAARRERRPPELPDVRQYQEFVEWERTSTSEQALNRSRSYWRDKLAGARITAVRTDFARSADRPKNTSVERFLVSPDVTVATLELARATRSSAFMVLLSAYNVLLRELTGQTDITVTTVMSGRGPSRFEGTIGSFFNFALLRTDLDGTTSFREVVGRTRRTCLGAFSNAIPFARVMADSPELAGAFGAEESQVFAFQVFQFPFVMAAQRVGEVEYSEIRRRLLPATVSTDIPDGALWTIDIDPAGGEMIGQLQFNSNRTDASTVRDLVARFQQVLKQTVSTPD
ncbi:condensation domain-containing protein [Actinophytocola oryzae]|uniref:Condensation domain-containing protein n=1 Tax=Actinophytocola oryzae TaxID=502181 RepID=A0A4R7UW90_9PSEU|nr:condensation domain-containing protein [Actinophytocola oryzae]TDV41048.1 condensation domain-containing protein [Actinophytocola oryzae]